MYSKIFSLISIFSLLTLILAPAVPESNAQQWSYVGLAKTANGSSFYIFVDKTGNGEENDAIRFRQKHSFNSQRSLPAGTKYRDVEISRVIDCNSLEIADREAVFKDENGAVVEKYISGTETRFTGIDISNNVNYEIYKIMCNKE